MAQLDGTVTELKVALRAVDLGYFPSKPMVEGCRYDLVLDDGNRLWRVQVKHTKRIEGPSLVVTLKTAGQKKKRSCYTGDEIDAVVVYHTFNSKFYWLPLEVWNGKSSILLCLERIADCYRSKCAEDFEWTTTASARGTIENRTEIGYKKYLENRPIKPAVLRDCEHCGKKTKNKRFCNPQCSGSAREIEWPIDVEEMVNRSSRLAVAKRLGVSNKAVAKRLRKLETMRRDYSSMAEPPVLTRETRDRYPVIPLRVAPMV